jgi:hypothetical protein
MHTYWNQRGYPSLAHCAVLTRCISLLQKPALVMQLVKCLVAGLVLGSIWFQLADGDVQARCSLFATVYIAVNINTVDALEGIYVRKQVFTRES